MKRGASPLNVRNTVSPRPSAAPEIGASFRPIYEYFAFYCAIAAFGVASFLWSVTASILYPLMPVRWGETLGQFMIMLLCRGFVFALKVSGLVQCDVRALDALKRDRSIVIAANHPSLLDAIFVLSRLPQIVCVAKPEIWDNLFLGGAARLAGFIRNTAPISLIKIASRQVHAGHQLLIFPEGTRTVREPVNDFKGGFALVARKAGAPIQTLFIESNSRFLAKGWPLLKKPAFSLFYRISLGRRFEIAHTSRAVVLEIEDYYRHELRAKQRAHASA